MEAKAEEKTNCTYEGCPEEALKTSKEGYCIFHQRDDNKDRELFYQKLQMKLKIQNYNFRGYYFIETDRKLIYYFRDYVFPKDVDFREAQFSVDTTFGKTQFLGEANFDDSKFLGNAFFDRALFSGKCFFKKTEFLGVSSFYGAKFNKLSDFQHVKFLKGASFPYAIFSGRAIFFSTNFESSAKFQAAKFHKQALFMRAIFRGDANFESAKFFDTLDLKSVDLSAFRFAGSNIETLDLSDVKWPKKYLNIYEKTAKTPQEYKTAEHVYRKLKISYHKTGNSDETSKFYYREMECKRKRILLEKYNIIKKLSLLIVYNFWKLYFGYGEKPWRVISFSVSFILLCALLFMVSGINNSEGLPLVKYNLSSCNLDLKTSTIKNNLMDFKLCTYYSVITFTTLGYGDVRPTPGLTRLLSMLEALFGVFSMAVFVVTFTRKVTR